MSVPTWRRKLSSCEYVYQTYQLNKVISDIYVKSPKKYRGSYGDHMIRVGLECLELAQIANSTFVNDSASYNVRKEALLKLIGKINNVSTTAYIFIETMRFADGMKPDKLYEWENRIGELCLSIEKMARAVNRKTVLKS